MHSQPPEHSVFCAFEPSKAVHALAGGLTFSMGDSPHPICVLAASDLQKHLQEQQDWEHNFGLSSGTKGAIIGKMFGVLVVRTQQNELGYLSAFSGKLANGNYHNKFVPPLFDGMAEGGFLNAGMRELTRIGEAINQLEQETHAAEIQRLKTLRKTHSHALQNKIFEQYNFLNKAGVSKKLVDVFKDAGYKKPPAGAGECAAPKLLQYAFQHAMEPLALAEFWWGLSPKSETWKHGHYYAPCKEKCGPILAHMLG